MDFTLTYEGDLPPNGSSREKWRIRRELEPQLRRLWTTPPLDEAIGKYQDAFYRPATCYVGRSLCGIEYVPLISPKLDLRAELKVLLLSSSLPGGLLHAGDIDNRLKTLFDALSAPANEQQVPPDAKTEPDGRLFCLLDDDKLVTRVDVSNARLLTEPLGGRKVLVLIRVRPIAFRATNANAGIAS